MKTTTTVLVVLLALISLAVPVFGASVNAGAAVTSNGIVTAGNSFAVGTTNTGDTAGANSANLVIVGSEVSNSAATASADNANANSNGAAAGIIAISNSGARATDPFPPDASTVTANANSNGNFAVNGGSSQGGPFPVTFAQANAGAVSIFGVASSNSDASAN